MKFDNDLISASLELIASGDTTTLSGEAAVKPEGPPAQRPVNLQNLSHNPSIQPACAGRPQPSPFRAVNLPLNPLHSNRKAAHTYDIIIYPAQIRISSITY